MPHKTKNVTRFSHNTTKDLTQVTCFNHNSHTWWHIIVLAMFLWLNPIMMLALWSPHGFDMFHMLNIVMSIFTKIVFELSQIKHYYFRVTQSGQSSSC
jgi:hypothetical protein